MPVKFFPLDQVLQPTARFGGGLDHARNLIPAYAGWRSLRKRSVRATNPDQARPISNAFQHIYTSTQGLQFFEPANHVLPFDLGTNARLSDDNVIDEDGFVLFPEYVGGAAPDDSKFVVVGGALDTVINIPFQNGSNGKVVPSSANNWKLRVRYKVSGNASGTWEVNYRLVGSDTGELVASTVIETGTGAGTDGWKTFEKDFTGNVTWEVADPVEYVYVEIEPVTTAGNQIVVPTVSTNPNNWLNQAASSTNIHESIDDGSTDDDTNYITSPIIGTTGSTDVTFDVVAVEPYQHASATVSGAIKVRWKKPQAGGQLSWELIQDTDPAVSIATGNIGTAAAQAAITTTSIDLTAAQWNSISDFTKLKVKLSFAGGEPGVSLVTKDVLPSSVLESGTWGSNTGGSDVLIGDINANGGQYAQSPYVSGPGASFQVPMELDFATYVFPGFSSGHTFKVDTDTDSASATAGNLKLFAGSQFLYNDDISYPTTEATQSITLDDTDVSRMQANPADLTATFAGHSTSDSTHLIVDFMRFVVPEPMQVYVYNVYLDFPPATFVAVSWVELQTPIGDTVIIDDLPTIYAGDQTNLYTVNLDTGVFSEISIAGGYFTGTTKPRAWQFAQWGNDVIATNYVDPVQLRTASAGDFADMITSAKKPRARFVAVVRDQVWLGDTTGESEASADGVWWSAIDNAADLQPSPTTQCDYQRLRQTPGQVMGLIGGEYAIIFKRDSIYRADYEGPPYFYSFKLLSTNEGTPFTRSIVPVERDVYFHTGGEFLVLRHGEGLQRIQPPPLHKYFDDKFAFPSTALFPAGDAEFSKEDLAVFGAFDHHSNLIFWFIQNATYSGLWSSVTPAGYGTHHNICAVYDVKLGRWSDLRLTDVDLAYATALCSRMHWDYASSSHNRSLVGFSYESRSSTAATYVMDLDGINGVANGGNIFDVQDGESFTFRIRFSTSDSGGNNIIFSKGNFLLATTPYYALLTSAGQLNFTVSDDSFVSANIASASSGYATGTTHEAWTIIDRVTGTLKMRVGNGDAISSVSADISDLGSFENAEDFLLGSAEGSAFFDGLVDELAVWNRALSDAEINDYFGKPLPVGHDAIAYYPMNENTGTNLVNVVPGGLYNLALTGGFAWVAGGLPKTSLAQTAWTFTDNNTYAAEVQTNFFTIEESMTTTLTGVRPVFTFDPEGVDTVLSISVRACTTPSIAGVTSSTSATLDEDGWYNLPSIAGEFFEITAAIPSSSTLLAHEILGFEVRYADEAGE